MVPAEGRHDSLPHTVASIPPLAACAGHSEVQTRADSSKNDHKNIIKFGKSHILKNNPKLSNLEGPKILLGGTAAGRAPTLTFVPTVSVHFFEGWRLLCRCSSGLYESLRLQQLGR